MSLENIQQQNETEPQSQPPPQVVNDIQSESLAQYSERVVGLLQENITAQVVKNPSLTEGYQVQLIFLSGRGVSSTQDHHPRDSKKGKAAVPRIYPLATKRLENLVASLEAKDLVHSNDCVLFLHGALLEENKLPQTFGPFALQHRFIILRNCGDATRSPCDALTERDITKVYAAHAGETPDMPALPTDVSVANSEQLFRSNLVPSSAPRRSNGGFGVNLVDEVGVYIVPRADMDTFVAEHVMIKRADNVIRAPKGLCVEQCIMDHLYSYWGCRPRRLALVPVDAEDVSTFASAPHNSRDRVKVLGTCRSRCEWLLAGFSADPQAEDQALIVDFDGYPSNVINTPADVDGLTLDSALRHRYRSAFPSPRANLVVAVKSLASQVSTSGMSKLTTPLQTYLNPSATQDELREVYNTTWIKKIFPDPCDPNSAYKDLDLKTLKKLMSGFSRSARFVQMIRNAKNRGVDVDSIVQSHLEAAAKAKPEDDGLAGKKHTKSGDQRKYLKKAIRKELTKRTPEKFTTKAIISDDVREFLTGSCGVELTENRLERKLWTRHMWDYIKAHNLQPSNKKSIVVLDGPMAKIFQLPVGTEVPILQLGVIHSLHFTDLPKQPKPQVARVPKPVVEKVQKVIKKASAPKAPKVLTAEQPTFGSKPKKPRQPSTPSTSTSPSTPTPTPTPKKVRVKKTPTTTPTAQPAQPTPTPKKRKEAPVPQTNGKRKKNV